MRVIIDKIKMASIRYNWEVSHLLWRCERILYPSYFPRIAPSLFYKCIL
jgi:hypothetical protein